MTRLPLYLRDCMKECAADVASPAASAAERLPLRVRKVEKLLIGARRDQRCIVELMPAYHAAGRSKRAVGENPRFAVSEVQSAGGETRRMSKEADHGVARPFRILKALTEHHVAAALAVHRAGRRETPHPLLETTSVCQHARM